MKKFIRVVVLVIVGVVVGGYLIDFLNNMPEEWLLATGVPLVGVVLGLCIGLPLQALLAGRRRAK